MAVLEPFALERDFEKPKLKSPCPKCGGKGVNVHYCTSEHVGQDRADTYTPVLAHLDLECQWCGYIRFMLTKDYGVTTVQERNVTT